MNYSKQYINEITQKSRFLANNTEKVIRLLDVLKFIDAVNISLELKETKTCYS